VRKVLIAIAVLIVLVWLIPWDLEPDGETQIPPPVAPVVATPEDRSTPGTDNAPVLSAEPAAEEPALLPDKVPLTPMEQKAQSARALIDPGLASIEKAFAAETVDPLWATGMEGHLLGQLAQANLQLVTMQVECRTSMCRIQLVETPVKRPDPAGTFHDLVRDLGLELWRVNRVIDQSGTPTLVAHLARPGDCSHGKDRSVCYPPQE
jgi:hypothetical protein